MQTLWGGRPPSSYLAADATAVNSGQLDGKDPSSFLGAPVTVHERTYQDLTMPQAYTFLNAQCAEGETAVGGGIRESGLNALKPGLGFGGTYQLRGSGPGLIVRAKTPPGIPFETKEFAGDGDTPTLWLANVTVTTENEENPELTVYVVCVPSR